MSEQIKRVFEFLQNAGTFYLATVEGDQRRVMGFFDTAHRHIIHDNIRLIFEIAVVF